MDDILAVHAARGQTNKTPVSSQGRNITVRCHSKAKKISKISTQITSPLLSVTEYKISIMIWRSYFYPPLPRHLVVWVVVATDAEAKQLAGSALNLEPLDLQGTLKEPVAGLKVPVTAPQEMHAADWQEVS